MCCDFESSHFFVLLVWFRVNKLMDSDIDLQIIKLPSFPSHPLVSRVPVNRIKRLHSRIFSIPSGLPIHPNTGVSRYIKCRKQVSVSFLESWYYSVKIWMSTFNRGLRKTVQILDIKDWLCWISGIPCSLLQLKIRMLVFFLTRINPMKGSIRKAHRKGVATSFTRKKKE